MTSGPPATGTDKAPKPPIRYVQFNRGLINDRVAERLGQDPFVLAVVLVDLMDQLWWRPVGLYRTQACDLCGFPRTSLRRFRSARQALIDDGWLRCQIPGNGERCQAIYEMVLKVVHNPEQIAPGKHSHPIQNAPGDDLDPEQCAPGPGADCTPTRSKSASDPEQFDTTSIPTYPSIPLNTPSNTNTPLNPPRGEVFALGNSEKGKSSKKGADQSQVDQIYLAYPKHVKPAPAKRAIAKALKTVPFDDLLSKVQAYAAATSKWDDRKYILHPATWFNAESWNDDPAEWVQKTSATQFGNGRPSLSGVPGQSLPATAVASNDISKFR